MLRQRALSAAILAPPLIAAVILGGPFVTAVIVLATGIGAFETFRLLRAAGHPSFWMLGTVLAAAIVVEPVLTGLLPGGGMLAVGVGVMLVAVASFSRPEPRDGVTIWAATVFGALYIALLGFVLRLGVVAPPLPAGAPLEALRADRGWIVLLVLSVWAFDTGAYAIGRLFGRHRFLRHISPAKTWEGVGGGVVAATVVSAVVLQGLGQPASSGLVVGPLVAFAAQAGDLAESMLKRAAGAKDSSALIPGHGGVLDRVDSFLFAAPALTIYVVVVVR